MELDWDPAEWPWHALDTATLLFHSFSILQGLDTGFNIDDSQACTSSNSALVCYIAACGSPKNRGEKKLERHPKIDGAKTTKVEEP